MPVIETLSERRIRFAGCFLLIACVALVFLFAPSHGQSRQSDDARFHITVDRTLSDEVSAQLMTARHFQSEDNSAAMDWALLPLLDRDISSYERYRVLELLSEAALMREDFDAAIDAQEGMLASGVLTPDGVHAHRVSLGEFHLANGDAEDALRWLEYALEEGAELTPQLDRLMAEAHLALGQPDHASIHIERVVEDPYGDRTRSITLLTQYFEAQDVSPQGIERLEADLERAPEVERNWLNLIAAYTAVGRQSEAFEVQRLMYLSGGLSACADVRAVAGRHSESGTPYRGAIILERALNASQCRPNDQSALGLLATLWQEAREPRRAIAPLQRLAEEAREAEVYEALGDAHMELENRVEAATAFATALEVSSASNDGPLWVKLGRAYYEHGERELALQAYRRAAEAPSTRREGRGWVQFIEAQLSPRQISVSPIHFVRFEECRLIMANEIDVARITGQVDEYGLIAGELPGRCERYFDVYGNVISRPDMTPEENADLRRQVAFEVDRRRRGLPETAGSTVAPAG